MKRESLVFAVSGTLFGVIVGWILGSQVAPQPAPTAAPAAAQAAPAAGGEAPPPLDMALIGRLEQQASAEPGNPAVRVQLGNAYFDGQRFDLAIPWYEAALALTPGDVNASTDLAVCYYYTNQVDRALAQLDRSLAMEPNHVKTIFNQGIIRAGGKQDLAGATESFQRVVALAPNSPEGQQAQNLLDTIAGHADGSVTGGAGSGAGG